MAFIHCCLLFVVFIHSCPPFVSSQYLPDTMLRNGPGDINAKRLANAIYYFTTDLHKKILESDPDGNVFFSPTSIYVALAMLYPGSGGETKYQLAEVLHLDVFKSDENEFYESIKNLIQTMSSSERKYILKMANRLYGQKGLQFKGEYLKQTKEYFRAELEALDFSKDPSGSRSKINSWVARMTSDKIKELFPKGSITRNTVLVLTNAVYFNASWLHPFDKKKTKPQSFYASKDQKVQVPMMHLLLEGLRYASSPGSFSLLELPYTDENVSMIIVLDEREDDFDTFLRGSLTDTTWDEEVQISTDVAVQLSLPKFNLHHSMDLQESLEAIGMKDLFGNADLSGIAVSPLKLSKALHQACIDVGESGTEAAAATGIGVARMSLAVNKKTTDFIVDREFLFFVVEKTTGSILFFGHIKDPLKSN